MGRPVALADRERQGWASRGAPDDVEHRVPSHPKV
jgi:hypothetical protein